VLAHRLGEDTDNWAKDPALASWSYAHCLPYFRRSETYDQGADDYRGGDGPLHVTKGFGLSPLYQVFLEAACEASHALVTDMNGYRQEGFGRMDMTIHKGVRESTARAYLRPAERHPNLTICTGAMVSHPVTAAPDAFGNRTKRGIARPRHSRASRPSRRGA
jgi:choline dehydrogenase